jgi:UDP-3-O-[3-hydroxymyristoyl] glucosamine N-acyltransferase
VIRSHVVLYEDAQIGADCQLYAGVHVREGCRIGDRVILQDGVIVGADGFGFAKDGDGRYHKIPQVGIVVIEDDVEIQAHTTVDRAALGETRIGRGTKIDNLVQVAHSVSVGSDTILCAQVGIAGSSKIGSRVTLAGQVGVANHVTIGDGVIATAQTGIPSSVAAGKLISGYPAVENRTWLRSSVLFAKLPELFQRLRAIERRLGGHGSQDH